MRKGPLSKGWPYPSLDTKCFVLPLDILPCRTTISFVIKHPLLRATLLSASFFQRSLLLKYLHNSEASVNHTTLERPLIPTEFRNVLIDPPHHRPCKRRSLPVDHGHDASFRAFRWSTTSTYRPTGIFTSLLLVSLVLRLNTSTSRHIYVEITNSLCNPFHIIHLLSHDFACIRPHPSATCRVSLDPANGDDFCGTRLCQQHRSSRRLFQQHDLCIEHHGDGDSQPRE